MRASRTALISVYDKTGIDRFASRLTRLGFQILSTGKTAQYLKSKKISVREVSDYTGFEEILDGRVKTLHPKIFAGILARSSAADLGVLKKLGVEAIDLVVVNLYPFESSPNMENIDIGGPSLLRAAAKNFERVVVVTDVGDYDRVADAFEKGEVSLEFRRELAGKVFARTAQYELAIARFFSAQLRYGENPHQKGAFLPGIRLWEEVFLGKELSYNNILDADAIFWLMREFLEDDFACAILKHASPCGVALSGKSLADAFDKAFAADPTSAFGGIVALNREVDAATAKKMSEIFLELILAPSFSKEAQAILKTKKNLRLLKILDGALPYFSVRSAGGGFLIQDVDTAIEDAGKSSLKTKRKPTALELKALQFSWKVCKHVRSNAIVLSDEEKTLGIGAGQTSRIDSVKIAVQRLTGKKGEGVVAASDGFFPFADNIDILAKSGVTAIIQPGGSLRDAEVIQSADHHNIAMLFTAVRHFRH